MVLLTTENALNRTFVNVKFREGYDQVEVDELLDEIASTIFALNIENQDLKDELGAAKRRIAEFSSATEAMPYVELAPVPTKSEEPMPAAEEPVVTAPWIFEPLATESESVQSVASMLALAQRVHDECVRDGKEESERIIAEARQKGDEITVNAQNRHETILAQPDRRRGLLEIELNELRTFRSEYRTDLHTHFEDPLSQVNAGAEERQYPVIDDGGGAGRHHRPPCVKGSVDERSSEVGSFFEGQGRRLYNLRHLRDPLRSGDKSLGPRFFT